METERLRLRRITADDVGLLVELDSDPEVMRFLTGQPTPRKEIENVVLPEILKVYDEHPELGTFAAEQKVDGTFIGWFGLQPTAAPKTVDVGYRLKRTAWGKGYATEGTRALIDKAFAELGADRVYASTMAVNTASRRVMEKAGMRFVRTFHADWPVRIPGDEDGDVEYAIDRAQWERDRSPS